MKLIDLLDKELETDYSIPLEEDIGNLFKISPALAFFAFKDNVITKAKDASNAIKDKAEDLDISLKQKKEIKAAKNNSRSGNFDDDTVYTYTKEQKQFLTKLYKKYGSSIIKEINDFRVNVAAPYQVIKREVAKNHMITDKTRVGMTKEEYYKYRESGRRKIEKMKDYFKDSSDSGLEAEKARRALEEARKTYYDFKNGKNVDLSAVNIEKLFDEAGIGLSKLNGYSLDELGSTYGEIKRLQNILKAGPNAEGRYKISGSERTGSARTLSADDVQIRINNLREKGITSITGKKGIKNQPYGSFREAFSFYMLRREMVSDIRRNSTSANYKKFYEKVLKDALDAAQKSYDNKYSNYMGMKNTITLNSYEKKIWQPKFLGNKYSGKLEDWKLKIKPEDFKGVEYREKSPKIIEAEKAIDRETKRFERSLKEKMSEEDLSLCRKYRLFSNFLTVKQLKSSGSIFKSLPKEPEDVEIDDKIDSIISKSYSSIRELESAQSKLRNLIKGENLSDETKKKCENFLNKINPENETVGKTNTKDLEALIDKINSTVYSKTSANIELKNFENTLDDFKRLNGEEALKPLNYEINQAKDKLNRILNDE